MQSGRDFEEQDFSLRSRRAAWVDFEENQKECQN
jgi:hypothetical protein